MTEFVVTSVQGGYIIRYWVSSTCKTKYEVYPTAQELRDRLASLVIDMEEED